MVRRRRSARDPERESLERDRFIVLQHLHTLCADGSQCAVAPERVSRDLALPEDRERVVVQDLVHAEMVAYRGWGVAPTRKGVDYLEREAGRRRSVRLDN